MRKQEKQPWNPFPLRSLNVKGLTACAKTVLIYLAARSNHKGETCVGHRRMQEDLVRSADFITTGLKELYAKGLVKHSNRNRSKGEAEWRTLDQSILKSRTKDVPNPEEQDKDQSCQAGVISPAEQDYVSPAQQCRTLQISTPNLADDKASNLADFSVCHSVSLGADAPLAQERDTDKNLHGFTAEETEEVKALANEIGCSDIASCFGLPYFTTGHEYDLVCIAAAMYARNRSVEWLARLVIWAKGGEPKDRESQFWKRRLQVGDKGITKLAEFLEAGTIADQFDAKLVAEKGSSEVFSGLRENSLLLRVASPEIRKKAKGFDAMCPDCGYDKDECSCKVIAVGKGFDIEEAE